MRIIYFLILLSFFLFGFSINNANAVGYIKFDGIDGESTDDAHKGWVDLLSISERLTSDSTNMKDEYNGSGKIVFFKNLDRTSPSLAESISVGKVFPKVLINLCSDVKSSCLNSYELTNVVISSYFINGSANNIPVEEVSLNFEKLVYNPAVNSQVNVPEWIKSTAKFWIDGDVSDKEFVDALGFLVKQKVIDVNVESNLTEEDTPKNKIPQVPAWISQTTDWWINGEVPEDQFLEGIKWMIKNKIISGF